MARKTIFTTKGADLIVKCISLGYTLKDTAYVAGVSTETIRRWRDRYPDFNKRIVEASNYQWDHPEAVLQSSRDKMGGTTKGYPKTRK